MVPEKHTETVGERLTGKPLLELSDSLVKEGLYEDALSAIQMGLEKGALRINALPTLQRIAMHAEMTQARRAVDLMRYARLSVPCKDGSRTSWSAVPSHSGQP